MRAGDPNPPHDARASPRFHRLRVEDVRRETASAVSVAFAVPEGLRGQYAFEAGQYLTLRATIEGEDLRRSYSICSGPDDGELRVAVKQVPGGVFSTWVNTEVRAGDAMEVMTPTGRFGRVAGGGGTYVAFAAGSGVTPILSIVRGVLHREAESRVVVFYGNRSTGEMLFREAFEALKDRFMRRLSVFHVLSREEQDVPVLNGRLDGAKVRQVMRAVVPIGAVDHAFVCGPAEMIDDISATLLELGLRGDQVHAERFVSALGGRPRVVVPPPMTAAPYAVAVLVVDGKRSEVPVAEGEAVLDAALRAGLDLPFACKGGMCSTCRARVVEGSVEMAANFSLEPWETEAGFVLTCQARPTTGRVVVDFDSV